jgi:hypothetical protein
MVRAFNIAADEGALEPRPQLGGDEDIVNPPTNIEHARAGQRAPGSKTLRQKNGGRKMITNLLKPLCGDPDQE